MGESAPRTAHSFIPEFETALANEKVGRLSVKEFSKRLSDFFVEQWKSTMPENFQGPDLIFLIGGYDEGKPHGSIFEVSVPSRPYPLEWYQGAQFGVRWGGQRENVERIMKGYDDSLMALIQSSLNLTDSQRQQLVQDISITSELPIPFQLLPLQDCVDLTIFLIRMTISLQNWIIGIRGVGGAIDVATITRTAGYGPVQRKEIIGEQRS